MQILSLMDRPSPNSFGMHAILADPGDAHDLIVIGEARGRRNIPRYVWSPSHTGILDVRALSIIIPDDSPSLVAGWYGDGFSEQVTALNAPQPEILTERHIIPGLGSFWLEDPKAMYPRLEHWLKAVLPRTLKEKSKALVELMHWTLPLAPETLAASWYTRDTPQEKNREIDLQVQLTHKTSNALIAAHEVLISAYLAST